MAAADPDELKAALQRIAGTLTVRETHISCVFLAGERAYKLKKPIVLPLQR